MKGDRARTLVTPTLWVMTVGIPSVAIAQQPDVRDIKPAVMLLIDTSGSMEYAINARSGTVSGRLPDCSRGERSRWIGLLEVLTGRIENYSCERVNRQIFSSSGAPDALYPLPHTRPLSGSGAYGSSSAFRQQNGILDTYLERVKFGLMVYDNIYGLAPSSNALSPNSADQLVMVPQTEWIRRAADSLGPAGDFSYGPDRLVTFPGCSGNYMVNAGARNENVPTAAGAGLISYGIDSPSDPNRYRTINATIQDRLLRTRPYGATPTAALLQDYEFFLNNHPHAAPPSVLVPGERDRFTACRPHYAILITDGLPTDPFRTVMRCDAPGFVCPYDRPVDIVSRLCNVGPDGRCTSSRFQGLFAVLFQPGERESDPEVIQARAMMHAIAAAGGTCRDPAQCAYLADDPDSLNRAISEILDRVVPGTRSRTSPSFVSVAFAGGGRGQYEITSGFLVGTPRRPWSGVLNRQRWECDGLDPVARPIEERDRFAFTLNRQERRDIYTVVTRPEAMTGTIVKDGAFTPPGAATGRMTPFAVGNGALTPQHFGLGPGQADVRNAIIQWVRAEAGSGRENHKLGDIYHSQPVVVTAPNFDLADEWYNLFRRRPEVAERPPMVYFGTNDGILHAFVLTNHRYLGNELKEGQELWGFVPPGIFPKLNTSRFTHQFLVDGSPVVKDVFFRRRPGELPNGEAYHTVLLIGLRQGGPYYIALDVTNPINPQFLWQWTHEHMGLTYGRPALTQVVLNWEGHEEQRAVAILPGGMGTRRDGECNLDRNQVPPQSINQTRGPRTKGSCWSGPTGRGLWVVDVETGRLIRGWGAHEIQIPITGSVAVFPGQTGSIATRAYVTNADGVIWRLDMSSPDPNRWTFRPFHDIYWNEGPLAGHPSVDTPVLTVNEQQRPVIIVATGDIENLEAPGVNYVVSITEADPGELGAEGRPARAEINWEIRLRDNEVVTGGLELYDQRVYFGTFVSSANPLDACELGSSRIWGVHYRESGLVPRGYPTPPAERAPQPGLERDSAIGTRNFTEHYIDMGRNRIVMGVGITQRPSCIVATTIPDPYIGPRMQVERIGGGQFELVAQVTSSAMVARDAMPSVETFRRTLPPPISYTRTISSALVPY
ncbi:MAG: PilC/PilY family type IV pilus protein [Sandaracinaceae bacterium]|nr:PilC/PilY family type IV pilus protein [Sandaracinaceae bacterium]